MKWFDRIFSGKKVGDSVEWKEIEYFHDSWKIRIKTMSAYISENSTVIDFGSGKEWLKDYLPANCTYTAVDYIMRGTSNLVFDFNKGQFPIIHADYGFLSGCLEVWNI